MRESDVIAMQLAKEVSIARTLLEDAERRITDGSPPALVQMATRALHGCTARALELAAELTGARNVEVDEP